jgi:hypothetical protein
METLFDDKAQRTVICRTTAMDRGLPSIRVSATLVEVPGFADEVYDRLYFIDAFKPKSKKSDVPISAWGGHRCGQGQHRRTRAGAAADPLRQAD